MICPAASPLARFSKAMTLAPVPARPISMTRDTGSYRTNPLGHPDSSQKVDHATLNADQLVSLELLNRRARLGSQLDGVGEDLDTEFEEPGIENARLAGRGPRTVVGERDPRHPVVHPVQVLGQSLIAGSRIWTSSRSAVLAACQAESSALQGRQSIAIALAVVQPRELAVGRRHPLRRMREKARDRQPGGLEVGGGDAELGQAILFRGRVLLGDRGPARVEAQPGGPSRRLTAGRQP